MSHFQPSLILPGTAFRKTVAVYKEAVATNIPLRSRRKAEQLAKANATSVVPRDTASWVAGQTLAVYFDGSNESAWYVATEDEFDELRARDLGDADLYGEGKPFGQAREIVFVQFSGASSLAGQTIG